jgi:hypothetical protein
LCASVIAAANAIWAAVQQVPDDVEQFSDPSRLLELPFPFPGAKTPTDRFDFHDCPPRIRTFAYMGRVNFQRILHQLPAPPVYVDDAVAATFASSAVAATTGSAAAAGSPAITAEHLAQPHSAPHFFPPIRANRHRSYEMFLYGTIGWGKRSYWHH